MVRRRRNEHHARCGVSDTCDQFTDLVSGKLAAFARFCTLCHLDLELFGIGQVIAGDPESSGGNLFNLAYFPVSVLLLFKTVLIFTAFAGVALGADTVHGDCHGPVGFGTDRAVGHGRRDKTFNN